MIRLARRWSILLAASLSLAACSRSGGGQAPVKHQGAAKADEVKGLVGKAGGLLELEGGLRVEVPAGLLQEEVTLILRRETPTFDLSGKDFVGPAVRLGPRLTFAPGAVRLWVPLDKELPGEPADIRLMVYHWEKKEGHGPEGSNFVYTWVPCPVARFAGFSQDQKFLLFDVFESISDRTTKAPFGLLQAAFDLPKAP
ncbi:MAG: hypothetical protein GYA21_16175 [Myxococcales bacterium]|nr:hypothetical protein [Myxococcales bacterium]